MKAPPIVPRQPPVDPRARRVVKVKRTVHGAIYALECGHELARKLRCEPKALICTKCPAAGGHGGHDFQSSR